MATSHLEGLGDIFTQVQENTESKLYVLLAISFIPLMQWLRAYRLQALLSKNYQAPKRNFYTISVYQNFLNTYLPAKLGEVAMPFLLKKYNDTNFGQGTAFSILVKVYDLFVVLMMGGLVFILNYSDVNLLYKLLWPLIVMGLFFMPKFFNFGLKILHLIPFLKKKVPFEDCQYDLSTHFFLMATTVTLWLCIYCFFYFNVIAVDKNLGLWPIIIAASFCSISYAFPISGIANLGPMETVWVYILYLWGVAQSVSLPLILFVHLVLILANSVLTLIWWIYIKILIRKE